MYTPPVPAALAGTAVGKDESREFMAVFPDIVRDLTEAGKHLDIPDVTKWYAKVSKSGVTFKLVNERSMRCFKIFRFFNITFLVERKTVVWLMSLLIEYFVRLWELLPK